MGRLKTGRSPDRGSFRFLDPGVLVDGDLELRLRDACPGDPYRGHVPEYLFDMVSSKPPRTVMGRLSLRIGHTQSIEKYVGHIGYSVDPPFRGKRLAARSCLLVKPLARRHGINPLWITCNPENLASRRTCEIIGSKFIEIVPIPLSEPIYAPDTQSKCRYRLDI